MVSKKLIPGSALTVLGSAPSSRRPLSWPGRQVHKVRIKSRVYTLPWKPGRSPQTWDDGLPWSQESPGGKWKGIWLEKESGRGRVKSRVRTPGHKIQKKAFKAWEQPRQTLRNWGWASEKRLQNNQWEGIWANTWVQDSCPPTADSSLFSAA